MSDITLEELAARLRAVEASGSERVTLREHLEARIQGLEKATEVAKSSMDARLAGMNEFRETLKDQAAKFVTRQEMDTKFDVIQAAIVALQNTNARAEGKASQTSVMVAYVISAVGIIMGVFSMLR